MFVSINKKKGQIKRQCFFKLFFQNVDIYFLLVPWKHIYK